MSDLSREASSPEPSASRRQRTRKRRSRLGRIRDRVQDKGVIVLTTLLALTILGSLLAVGTVHVVSLLFIAPVAVVAAALAIWLEDIPRRRLPAPAIILGLLALYSLLQSVPLPFPWVKALSPTAAQTWLDALRLLGLGTEHRVSLSVEPGASRVEALKWLSYAAVFVASSKVAREKGAERGILIVVGSALLGGLLSVGHGLFGLEDWLGLYHPETARPPWAIAPLLNPNNFAGYLNLALFSGTGLLFARKAIVPRWATALVLVVFAALVILTGSRGGVLALAVGFAFTGIAFHSQQRHARARGYRILPAWVPMTGLAIAAVALAVIGATDVVWQQLLDETTGKLRILEYSKPVIADHLWFGTGRGSFGTAYAPYRQELGDSIAHYAENFVVQWVVEWGLPAALLGFVALGWTLRPTRLRFGRAALHTGVLVAVAVLLLQNLVDLATEIASVTLAVFALLGTLDGASHFEAEKRRRSSDAPASRPRALRPSLEGLTALLLGFALVLLVVRTGLPDSIDQRRILSEALQQTYNKPKGDPSFSRVRARVTAAMLRCPGDPFVPVIGALLTRESGQSPYVWLGQAIRRDPLSPRPHFLLAETLAARKAKHQAFLELKTTVKLSPRFINPVADLAFAWASDIPDLLRAVPDGTDGVALLNALVQRHSREPERRDELLRLSLERSPEEPATNELAAGLLFASLEANAPACLEERRPDCEARLLRHATVVINNRKNPEGALVMRAKLLAHEHRLDEAERLLAEHCGDLPAAQSCQRLRCAYAAKLQGPERFESAAMAFTSAACSNANACASAFSWIGQLELGRRNQLSALSRFLRAAEEQPTAQAWLTVAELAAQTGRLSQSRSALNTARRLGGGPRADEIEKRLQSLQRDRMLEALGK